MFFAATGHEEDGMVEEGEWKEGKRELAGITYRGGLKGLG